MAKVTDLLNEALQEVHILEEQIHGASPLEAKLRDQEASLQQVAKSLVGRLTEVENREQANDARSAALDKREAAVEASKQALKDLQKDLLAKPKA